MKSYLRRGQINLVTLGLSSHARTQGAPLGGLPPEKILLRCAEASVGVYVGPGTWFEVQLADGSTQLLRVKHPVTPSNITGLALAGSHEVYASFGSTQGKSASAPAGQRGLYALDLNGQKPTWVPFEGTVQPSGTPQGFGRLIGRDGSSLVYMRNGAIGQDGAQTLLWSNR